MPDQTKIQVNFSREHNGITYSDSLYYSPDEYGELTQDAITAAEDERFNNWVAAITNPPPVQLLPQTVFSKYQFLTLFTQTELGAILNSTDAGVKNFVFMFQAAEEIDTTDPNTVAGVNMLESLGLIEAGRAAQILTGTV